MTLKKLEMCLKTSINKYYSDLTNNADSSTHVSNSNNHEQSKKASIKLPKIPLPVFNGKIEEWNIFKTTFNTFINNNPNLSDNQKLFLSSQSINW